jgi:hypothetical protein
MNRAAHEAIIPAADGKGMTRPTGILSTTSFQASDPRIAPWQDSNLQPTEK